MRAQEFYEFGQSLRSEIDPFLPPEMRRKAPEQPQQPTQGTPFNPQGAPQSPTRGPAGEFNYDHRVVDAMVKQYTDAGYDPRFAIGMAANAVVESSLVPTAFNESEGAYGMFQWRNDRLDNLTDFADRTGKSINDINTQIAFSMQEFGAAERVAYDRIQGGGAESAADYARLIDKHYERSSGEARDRRAQIAGQLYQDYYGEGGRFSGRGMPSDGPTFEDVAAGAGTDAFNPDVAQAFSDFDPTMLNPAQPEQTARERGAADFATKQESVPGPGQPGYAGATPFIPPSPTAGQTATQPPSGGQLGTSSQAGGEGKLGGFRQIFTRREGESDASFGDRRRNIFLNAAEGFQMLSRGTKADFVTPTQQRLNQAQRRVDNTYRDTEQVRQQGNADRNYNLQRTQEARLQRAQAFEEYKYEQTTIKEQILQDAQAGKDNKMLEFFENSEEHKDLLPLAEGGQLDVAMDIYSAREEAKVPDLGSDYAVGPASANAAAQYADTLGRTDLSTQVLDDTNPRVQFEALKKINGLTAGDEDGGYTVDQNEYNAYVSQMPQGLTPSQQDRYKNFARMAAGASDATVKDGFTEAMLEVANSKGPTSQFVDKLIDSAVEEYDAVASVGGSLRDAGRTTMELAANPDFNPNQLKGAVLTPFVRYMRGIPGGAELAEKYGDVSDSDVFASRLLESVRSGELGNLSKGIQGQLSNLEGQMLLKRIADGTAERGEIMALGQMLVKGVEQDMAGLDAKIQYRQEVAETGERFSVVKEDERVSQARGSTPTFEQVEGEQELLEMQMRYAEEYDVDNYQDFPTDVKAKVVRLVKPNGDVQYVPLFKHEFKEYQ